MPSNCIYVVVGRTTIVPLHYMLYSHLLSPCFRYAMMRSQDEKLFVSELKKYISCIRPRFNCIHFNLQSGKNKYNHLECFFNEVNMFFDIIMFSETWFTSEKDVFMIPGYKPFFANRTGKRGGGVSMLVSNRLSCELLSQFSSITPNYETLVIKTGSCIFCVCYRPPDSSAPIFF